jgi:catechol-2,3-dioxygenase
MSTEIGWPSWIGIVCDDLAAQLSFYREVFGVQEAAKGDGWVQFEFGDRLLELIQRDESPEYERARYQVGFAVGDMEKSRRRLLGAGAEQISSIQGGADLSGPWCYFRDPEGNVFELKER